MSQHHRRDMGRRYWSARRVLQVQFLASSRQTIRTIRRNIRSYVSRSRLSLAGQITNLPLTTTGRRSGQQRTVPLAYLADGERFVVVASNGAPIGHPGGG